MTLDPRILEECCRAWRAVHAEITARSSERLPSTSVTFDEVLAFHGITWECSRGLWLAYERATRRIAAPPKACEGCGLPLPTNHGNRRFCVKECQLSWNRWESEAA